MKTLYTLVCATLLAGCTSATMQQSPFPARQEFGYPRIDRQPSSPAAQAAIPNADADADAPVTASRPPLAASSLAAAAPEARQAAYDEMKDPMMRELLAHATQPVGEELNMSDGKLLLPPPAELDIIDIRDISGALNAGADPSS